MFVHFRVVPPSGQSVLGSAGIPGGGLKFGLVWESLVLSSQLSFSSGTPILMVSSSNQMEGWKGKLGIHSKASAPYP